MAGLRNAYQRFAAGVLLAVSCVVGIPNGSAQPTMGTLVLEPSANDGYVLFSPNGSESTYLIDKCGRRIHAWETEGRPGLMAYLMDNGDLVRTRRHQTGLFSGGGIGGIIERMDWDGEVLWRDTLADFTHHQHHDVAVMPNGNVLAIVWEKWFAADAIARGQLPELASDEVWVTRIVELAPTPPSGSEVVWSWSPWEHLIQNTDPALPHYGSPADHPERFDVNYGAVASGGGPGLGQEAAYDWMHVNSIHYHPNRDEIMLSSRHWNEVWIIDHSTTAEEAAGSTGGQHGRGGDLLWRWGNPAAYGCGGPDDQQLFGQHDAQFRTIDGAEVATVYNNGNGRPEGDYSTVHHIPLPLDAAGDYPAPQQGQPFDPPQPMWTYPEPVDADFFSPNISGYERLPNGHHLICEGASGRFFELNTEETVVWEYINPVNNSGPMMQGENPLQNGVFRATEIPTDHPGLQGRDLTPGAPLEINPVEVDCVMQASDPWAEHSVRIWADASSGRLHITGLHATQTATLTLCDAHGKVHWTGAVADGAVVDILFWPPGVYIGILRPTAPLNLPASAFKIFIP